VKFQFQLVGFPYQLKLIFFADFFSVAEKACVFKDNCKNINHEDGEKAKKTANDLLGINMPKCTVLYVGAAIGRPNIFLDSQNTPCYNFCESKKAFGHILQRARNRLPQFKVKCLL